MHLKIWLTWVLIEIAEESDVLALMLSYPFDVRNVSLNNSEWYLQ